jgi:uncharacterized membrane protein YecN with MAPEG domain
MEEALLNMVADTADAVNCWSPKRVTRLIFTHKVFSMLPITSFFAGLFTLYFVRLAFNVIRLRRANKVALGAGGFSDLEGAIRAHGNFAEYVPLGLILLGLFESHSVHPVLVAVLGGLFALGRFIHARALGQANLKQRVRGMMLTFGTLVTLAVLNIVFAARSWLSH